MSRRDEILDALGHVELLTSPAMGAMQIINDVSASNEEIARALELDPALTANVLRFANSAYFGRTMKVETVKDALTRLGINVVARMLYMSIASQVSAKPVVGYDLDAGQLWPHLLASAVGTELLGARLKKRVPNYAFTAGLLHDIGEMVLGTFLEVDAEPICKLAYEENISFDQAEIEILGINHAEVGALLAEQWNLPTSISNVIRWHHEPDKFEGDQLVVDLVHTADIISMMQGTGLGIDGMHYTFSENTQERLGLKRSTIDYVICNLLDEVQKLESGEG